MAIRVVGGACPVHEEKRGVVNLTYKAIVSFTRIAANVHTECPTNVETLPWREEKELFVTDFSVFFSLSPSNTYISAQTPNPPHTLCWRVRVRKGPVPFTYKFSEFQKC